eukprot:CAMPEP_0113925102 /NCGR_PEP_ID=MMETSP1159-20121227/3022_1 /TAXON_ID=88271 /ORGANISM="Picocystis salinarum" /LENGTH=435 /DNA_ID=CAMNT_0000925365 /DNA_START=349 /DNA_END=1652 /DNA_ORIENTATION=- /assembly_acc=CAM_ASM_000767
MNSFATVATFVLFWLQFCRADGKHRLLVADSESGKIRVHDLADGEHVADLEVDGPARVYALSAGRYAFAVQTTSNSSHAIDGGVWIEDHGDHMHPYEQLPVVRPFKVEGATPIHFVEHGDQIAIFNDGTGSGSVMKTSDVAQADPPIHIVESGLAHHGVAVPVGNDVLISVADEGQRLPKGVDRRNRSSVVIQQMHECPLLHGEATSGSKVAFGCGDGVLIVDTSKSPMEAHKVASPDGEEGRVGTVYSHPEVGFFIGNHGPTGLSKIDPEGDTMVVFPVPVAVGAFGFTNDGHAIVAVTVDGHVHRISPTSGNILTSARIIAPYESGTRPALAFAPHKVIVSDHIEGTIHVLNDNDLSEEMTIDGDGIPLSMAVVGYESGDHDHDHDHDHDDDHDHDHDHDDDHDHDHGDGDHNGGKQRVTNKVLIVISSSIAL